MDTSRFLARDGLELVFRSTGSGRPVFMFHGLMSSGSTTSDSWTELFSSQRRRVIRPVFRGNGEGVQPHDARSYPPDVLILDTLDLIEHLGLAAGEYDLAGYSVGARVVLRLLACGAQPGRAIAVAQGLEKVTGSQGDASRRILAAIDVGATFEPDSPEARFATWATKLGVDVRAQLLVLDSLVPTSEEELRRIRIPTLIAVGDSDERADGKQLAALLPNGLFVSVPGNHESTFDSIELAEAMTSFLA